MVSAKVLGGITPLIIAVAVGAIFILLPDSGASQLMRKAFHLGWPGGLVIVILMLYFQFGRKNDPRRGELVFKSVIGLLGYSMLFIAIANYAMNFNDESPGVPGEPRFLPVSLVMFTVSCFMMAMYFKGVRVLLQIGGFMFFVAACLAGFGNWLPQVKADPPPVEEKTADVRQMSVQERADLGEKIIFGAVGASGTQGAIGKGQCPLCHGFQKPPIALSLDELIAVDTWLFAREGIEPPTPEEIENAYKKFIPEADRPKPAGAPGAAPAGPAPGAPVVTGDEPVNEIFIKALCFACHTIPGIQGAVGVVGPKLVEKTNAPNRLKDPNYKGNATTVREYIMESIITPSKYVVPGFPDNIMPKDFGKKLNAAAINKIINYLSQLEEGKAPPKIE